MDLIKPDAKLINALADEVYFGPQRHPSARHMIVKALMKAFDAGVAAARPEGLEQGAKAREIAA